jgi:TonB family protein
MTSDGGTFRVPVTINDELTLKFVIDSGAADVSVPADVVMTLVRTGTITDTDFLGKQTYKLADGSTVPSQQFVIRSLKVGDKTLENVVGSIAPVAGGLLLGQSFLSRFNTWSIDNQRQALILGPPPNNATELSSAEVPDERVHEPIAPHAPEAPAPSLSAYVGEVSAAIRSRLFYPHAARARRAKGVVGVGFTIGPSGAVSSFAITRSSGDHDLDAAARSLVQGGRFPPPPGGSAHIATSFNYFPR